MNKKMFYGWWIVIVGFIIMTIGYAPIINVISLYSKPVSSTFGVEIPKFTYYYTVMSLTSLIALPFIAQLYKRMNNKTLVIIGIILCGLSFIGFSVASSISLFYFIAVIQGIGYDLLCIVPPALLITNWFNKKRGLALGIAMSGSGFGGALLTTITSQLIQNYGWRVSYLVTGIAIFVILIPLVLFVVKFKPSEMGLEPLGQVAQKGDKIRGLTHKQTFATPSFWLLAIGIFAAALFSNFIIVYLFPYLTTSLNFSPTTAASFLSSGMIALAIAKITMGGAFDKIGIKPTVILIGLATVASMLCISFGSGSAIVLIGVILFGVSGTHLTVSASYLTARFFGEKDYGPNYSIVSMASGLGAAVGPIVGGFIYNNVTPFSKSFLVILIFTLIVFICFMAATILKPKMVEEI